MQSREQILERFAGMVRAGLPIIGAGAGTGLSAKCEEAGGVDLIIVYNSGRFRMAGRGSLAGVLAYGNANDIVVDMASEILPVVKSTPVIAGVNGTDPFCNFGYLLDKLKALGFCGVQNFPTVGLIDGVFRANLEETGFGFDKEVAMIRLARSRDMLTTPYVFNVEEAKAMAQAGADIVVAHMGLTIGGSIGAETFMSMDDCVSLVNDIAAAALSVRKETIVLCHGGPLAAPQDAQYVLDRCRDCHGFYGASSMERLPSEVALTGTMREFKSLTRPV
jgi:predicted TIM-barrel enzyme